MARAARRAKTPPQNDRESKSFLLLTCASGARVRQGAPRLRNKQLYGWRGRPAGPRRHLKIIEKAKVFASHVTSGARVRQGAPRLRNRRLYGWRLVRAATTLLQKTVFVCSMVIPRTLADVCRARSLPIKFSLCGARRVGCGRERPVCAINSSAVARAARRAKMLSKIVLVCSMVPPPRARRYVPPPLVT